MSILESYHHIVFDFDGVFTDNYVYVDENAVESIKVSRADGYAIDLLRKYIELKRLRISMLILSTETNKVVRARAKKLNIECISGDLDKRDTLESRFKSERPDDTNPFSGLIYFGNDLNDLPVMLKAGLSFAPSNAHLKVKEVSTHVLSRRGGHDFVREGVEFLIDTNSMSPEELSDFISNC